jgi:polysaccharide export outer membrane protein
VSFPEYVIEPPDILLIDAIRVVPKPPYRIEPLDVLYINVPNTLPTTEPINGLYSVEPEGTVALGEYGAVSVAGLTLKAAIDAVRTQLEKRINKPRVDISLGQSRALQQIRGEHLVRPDGTIGLGTYGAVHVTGLTLSAARVAIEEHLSQYLLKPEVSVDVFAYNSKVCYVIFDGGGYGQQIVRLPITGNDTVLDAIAQVSGLTPVSNKHRIRVARPTSTSESFDQVLAVDWQAITTRGRTDTNYQLLPGDRIYIDSDCWVAFDTRLARVLTPFERVFGFALLGSGTVSAIANEYGGGKWTKGGGSTGSGGGF